MILLTPPLLALFDVGGGELVLIGVVALLLFGGDLPKVMRQVGRVVADLRRQAESLTSEFREDSPRSSYPPPRVPRPSQPTRSLPVDAALDTDSPPPPPPPPIDPKTPAANVADSGASGSTEGPDPAPAPDPAAATDAPAATDPTLTDRKEPKGSSPD
jgi:sec-independent protein translocase protein TatA